MSQNAHTQSITLINTGGGAEVRAAFVLRLTWDANTLNWRVVLRNINHEEPRVFVNLESAFLHLESWMANQILLFNEETQS